MIPAFQHPRRTGQGPLSPSCGVCKDGEALTILLEPTDSSRDTKSTRKEGNGVTVPTAPLWNQAADPVFFHSTFNYTK